MSASGENVATAQSVGASGPYHEVRIARIVRETADAASFVLDVPEEIADRFAYRAGQFLTFRVRVGEERLVRCYSLASSPDTDDELKVTVKRIEEGRVSNWMNETLAVGDVLEAMRPAGVFCLQERTTPLVLFAGGSGITPVISILKSALATSARSVRLVYANRDRDAIIFREELDALGARHGDRLEVIHRLDVEDGFVDREAVERYIGDDLDADFYVCGPGPFMDTVEAALEARRVPAEQIFIERFVSLTAEEHAAGMPAAAATGGALREPGDAAPTTVSIRIDGELHEVPYVPGQTLLEAAQAAGLEPPFACEEGYCSCCMAKLAAGRVRMLTNDALDEDQVEEGWVLTCQSIPLCDEIEVDYPD